MPRLSNTTESMDRARFARIVWALKIRQKTFAQVARDLQVSRTTVCYVAKGRRVSRRIRHALARLCGFSYRELWG